jgi:hypothetical protein
MADCLYIPFGSINESKKSNLVDCVVWTRESLARKLGMTEKQFVELCIFIGNDYTMHFKRTLFNQYSQFITESEYSYLEVDSGGLTVPIDFILSQKPDFLLSSLNTELNEAIMYSRAVYNLSDLEEYNRGGKDSKVGRNLNDDQESIRSAEESSGDTYKLSKRKLQTFDDWILKDGKKDDNIGMNVTRFLTENLGKYDKSRVKDPTLNQNQNQNQSSNLFHEISEIHIEAFAVMLTSIGEKKSRKISQELDDVQKKLSGYLTDLRVDATSSPCDNKKLMENENYAAKSTKIVWCNAVAAHTYQLLCKRLMLTDAYSGANVSDDIFACLLLNSTHTSLIIQSPPLSAIPRLQSY